MNRIIITERQFLKLKFKKVKNFMAKTPEEVVKEKGLVQVTDVSAIEKVVSDVIARSQAEVEAYKGGKIKLLGYFVGQVMKETRGKANPKIVNDLLKKILDAG